MWTIREQQMPDFMRHHVGQQFRSADVQHLRLFDDPVVEDMNHPAVSSREPEHIA